MVKYDSYKDSGVEWVGEIPSHWTLIKLHTLVTSEKLKFQDGNHGGLHPIPEEFLTKGVPFIKPKDIQNESIIWKSCDRLPYERCEEFRIGFSHNDDVLLVNRGGSIGKVVYVSDYDNEYPYFVINPQVTYMRGESGLLSKYMFYTSLSDIFRCGVDLILGHGSTFPFLGLSNMGDFEMVFPPLQEQQQIVSFLDTKTSLIDSLIEKTQKKIELLKEKRTSLINQTVTKGLNPNVEMKDSGVEWIGEIPNHWFVKPIKYISYYNHKSLGNDTPSDYELDYLEISDVNSVGKIGEPTYYLFSQSPSRCRRILKKNDIIISTVRTYLRSIGFIENEVKNLICSTGFCVLSPHNEIKPKLLFYLVRSEWFISDVISQSVGVSYPGIQTEKLVDIKVILPPLSEQQQIVEYLDKQTDIIDTTITKEQKRIKLLKEYRQSLISEVVTGKIKVCD